MPDQRVICKLLCCSEFMYELVHAKCAGKLHVKVGSSDIVQGLQTLISSFSGGFHSNAMLVHSLTVAGTTPSETELGSSLTGAAAVAAAATASLEASVSTLNLQLLGSRGRLPLQSLTCCFTCNGCIFSTLAAARQLTGLILHLNLADPPAGCGDALAALTSLRELTLGVQTLTWNAPCSNFGVIGTALKYLTRLSHLNVNPDRYETFGTYEGEPFVPCLEAAGCVQALPPSLQCLQMSCGRRSVQVHFIGPARVINLEHLTRLSVLHLTNMRTGTVLPAGLRVLRLPECADIQPFVPQQLQHLEELHVPVFVADSVGMTHALGVLTGLRACPRFRELHLDLKSEVEPLQWLQAPADIPAVELDLHASSQGMSEQVVSDLGMLTKLTRLFLHGTAWRGQWFSSLLHPCNS